MSEEGVRNQARPTMQLQTLPVILFSKVVIPSQFTLYHFERNVEHDGIDHVAHDRSQDAPPGAEPWPDGDVEDCKKRNDPERGCLRVEGIAHHPPEGENVPPEITPE